MKKFLSLTTCLVLVVASLTGCTKPTDTKTFLMADVQTGDHPSAQACDKFAQMVKKETSGRVKIEVYHGDSLGSESDQLKQITVGGLDFARISSGQLAKYEEKFTAFEALYLYKQESDMWDILKGSVGNSLLSSKKLQDNNVLGLGWFSGGARNFYNTKKEIHSPADLKDLHLRVNTDSMFELLSKNGATGENIAYNDIYANLNKGKIDGAENNWPSFISTEHYKKCKYITIDQHNCLPELIVASKSAMDSISSEDQETIKKCAKEISKEQISNMKAYEKEAIETAKKSGVTVTELSNSEKEAFQKQGAEINAKLFTDYQDTIAEITGK